jgi:hypothetical protein
MFEVQSQLVYRPVFSHFSYKSKLLNQPSNYYVARTFTKESTIYFDLHILYLI